MATIHQGDTFPYFTGATGRPCMEIIQELKKVTVLAGANHIGDYIDISNYNRLSSIQYDTSVQNHPNKMGLRFIMPLTNINIFAGEYTTTTATTHYTNLTDRAPYTNKVALRVYNDDTADHTYNAYLWGIRT